MSVFPTLLVECTHRSRVEQAPIRKVERKWRGGKYSGLGGTREVVETVPSVRVGSETGKDIHDKVVVVVLRGFRQTV